MSYTLPDVPGEARKKSPCVGRHRHAPGFRPRETVTRSNSSTRRRSKDGELTEVGCGLGIDSAVKATWSPTVLAG